MCPRSRFLQFKTPQEVQGEPLKTTFNELKNIITSITEMRRKVHHTDVNVKENEDLKVKEFQDHAIFSEAKETDSLQPSQLLKDLLALKCPLSNITLLQYAVEADQLEITKFLVLKGADFHIDLTKELSAQTLFQNMHQSYHVAEAIFFIQALQAQDLIDRYDGQLSIKNKGQRNALISLTLDNKFTLTISHQGCQWKKSFFRKKMDPKYIEVEKRIRGNKLFEALYFEAQNQAQKSQKKKKKKKK